MRLNNRELSGLKSGDVVTITYTATLDQYADAMGAHLDGRTYAIPEGARLVLRPACICAELNAWPAVHRCAERWGVSLGSLS